MTPLTPTESDAAERTRDLFEIVPGYALPPLPPLPNIDDPTVLWDDRLPTGQPGKLALQIGFALSGFGTFESHLRHGDLDAALRRHDARSDFFPPVISASLTIADDPRRPAALTRAGSLILAACSVRDDIMSGRLPGDEFRGKPLEMGLYPNLFGTSIEFDERGHRLFKTTSASHICVVYRRRFFALNVGTAAARPTLDSIVEALAGIVAQTSSSEASDVEAAGWLSAASDVTQRHIFPELEREAVNATSLRRLRHSLFTVCLDLDQSPVNSADALRLTHCGDFGNRWYHASLQLVVFGNGTAGAICSFRAWLDGNTMMRGAAEVQQRAAAIIAVGENEHASKVRLSVEKLEWGFDPQFALQARREVESVLDDDPQGTFTLEGLGASSLRSDEMDSVSLFVAALALATHRLSRKTPDIGQFLVISRFRCLGVRVARVTTPAVERWVRNPGNQQLLREAVQSQVEHSRLMRGAMPLKQLALLFRDHWRERRKMLMVRVGLKLLRKLGFFRIPRRDILLSHPQIMPEVPLLGRPGVRLDYLNMFAMHYQIFDDRTVVTIARGANWNVPNAKLVEELQIALGDVQRLLDEPRC